MALNITTNITNTLDGYSLDASQVKGGFVTVKDTTARDALSKSTLVNGSLCLVAADSKMYKYNSSNSSWEVYTNGGEPSDYIKSITKSEDSKTLTITPNKGNAFTFTDTNTTYSVATTSANGLMSKDDKSKLDGITAGATKVSASKTPVTGDIINSITINDTPYNLP